MHGLFLILIFVLFFFFFFFFSSWSFLEALSLVHLPVWFPPSSKLQQPTMVGQGSNQCPRAPEMPQTTLRHSWSSLFHFNFIQFQNLQWLLFWTAQVYVLRSQGDVTHCFGLTSTPAFQPPLLQHSYLIKIKGPVVAGR